MPQGVPTTIPDDGLTTRERRNRPLIMVHTGPGKGKSTAAFGLAMRGWNQGFSIGVFQFVKSAKWRIGEQTVLERLGRLHEETGEGGPVTWHKMGSGWSWSRKAGTEEDHAADAAEGWEEVKRALAEAFGDTTLADLRDRGKHVLITAFCVTTGKPRIFKEMRRGDLLLHHLSSLRFVRPARSHQSGRTTSPGLFREGGSAQSTDAQNSLHAGALLSRG